MATINLRQQADVIVTSGGEVKQLGSVLTGDSITVTDVRDDTITVDATTTWDTWTSSDTINALAFLWVECASAVWIELTTDKDNDVGASSNEFYTIKTKAGVPFVLTSNISFADYTVDFAGGTADVIDQIRIRNDTAGALVVRAVIGTIATA